MKLSLLLTFSLVLVVGACSSTTELVNLGFRAPAHETLSLSLQGIELKSEARVDSSLLRLQKAGIVAPSFEQSISSIFNQITTIKAYKNVILVGGTFTDFRGTSAKSLLLLDEHGNIHKKHADFVKRGFDGEVSDIALSASGTLHIVGDFKTFDGKKALGYIKTRI